MVSARQGEPALHGRATRSEHSGLGYLLAVPVVVEVPGAGNPLGVVLPESQLWAADVLETVDEGLLSQPGAAANPASRVRHRTEINGDEGADGCQAEQHPSSIQSCFTPRQGGFSWCGHAELLGGCCAGLHSFLYADPANRLKQL